MISYFYRNTCPIQFKKMYLYKKWIDGDIWAILPKQLNNIKFDIEKLYDPSEMVYFYDDKIQIDKDNTFVNKKIMFEKNLELKYKEYSDEYFSCPLNKDSIIYCAHIGNKEYVSLFNMFIYFEGDTEEHKNFIIENEKNIFFNSKYNYFTRLYHHENEKTIGELYRNIIDYTYDFSDKTFKHISNFNCINKYVRHAKIFIEHEILKTVNSPLDRISDYSRLIYFIISKLENLTDDEKKIFENILEKNIPSLNTMSRIVEKDIKIKNMINAISECSSDEEVYEYIDKNIMC